MNRSFLFLFVAAVLLAGTSAAQVNKAQLPASSKAEGNTRLYDFNFVNTDVAAVMQALAVTAGVDIVPSPELPGIKIDLKITRKTWQEALDIVCGTYDFTWIIEDKYISVLKTASWQAKQLKAAEKKEQSEQVSPLVRKNFQIRHAKAAELVSVLQSMISARGRLTVVERNNAIIVYDNEVRLGQMEKALKELDVETQQIVISAKLVLLNSSVAQELGTDWSAKSAAGTLTAGGTTPAAGNLFNPSNQVALSSKPAQGGANAIAQGQAITMSLMDNNLGISIYDLIGEGKGELLASPQISTLDHTQAQIFMGDQISLRVIDATGQSSNQLVSSGIKLTVTPHISGDNRILMDLKPENNSWSYDEKGYPVISTQNAETKVVVADGETVVIGGLTKNEEQETETGIPVLKDIPIFGYLFKYYKKTVTKKDLIIFVTPRIQRNQMQEIQALEETKSINETPVIPTVNLSAPSIEAATPTPVAPVVSTPKAAAPVQSKQPATAPASSSATPTPVPAPVAPAPTPAPTATPATPATPPAKAAAGSDDEWK